MNRNKSIKTLLSLVLTLGLTACSVVPFTGRKRFSLVPDSELIQASRLQYTNFLTEARSSGQLMRDERTLRVAKRLVKAANSYLDQAGFEHIRRSMKWQVNVVNSPQVNAFCMPGGKMIVYKGLLDLIGRGRGADDQLAAVLGHEIGHALAGHASERMSNQVLLQLGGAILSQSMSKKSAILQEVVRTSYGLGGQMLVVLPFGRKQELESDKMGLLLMTRAGYNPDYAITLWQKMARHSGGKRNEFFSTHPSEERRIKEIKETIREIRQAQARGGQR